MRGAISDVEPNASKRAALPHRHCLIILEGSLLLVTVSVNTFTNAKSEGLACHTVHMVERSVNPWTR